MLEKLTTFRNVAHAFLLIAALTFVTGCSCRGAAGPDGKDSATCARSCDAKCGDKKCGEAKCGEGKCGAECPKKASGECPMKKK
ncbi:MAG: hypothetical protein KDD69_11120 [Bdellovibrionales bacterium]|nr:hypothetical protein [Bdellovibrionales bacterium]